MTIQRSEPSVVAGEREMLDGWLEYHRATLAWKCEGLTDAQLRERSAPPSSMSLLGLVRHMTDVERAWFRRRVAGDQWTPYRYWSDASPDGDFDEVDQADVAEAFAAWREECDVARGISDSWQSLDETFDVNGEQVSLRWIVSHMIEEYARHNGHADLLRERIDGAKGD
jgi:uncharacterized damage-inducible protein DinB